MRLDKFLSTTKIVKRRVIAQDMIKNRVVFVNGKVAKSSKNILIGDKIEICYLDGNVCYEVLKIPASKTVSKKEKDLYIRKLYDKRKH
jgi:ribosomal 50S subunit-recycling heat shock protein